MQKTNPDHRLDGKAAARVTPGGSKSSDGAVSSARRPDQGHGVRHNPPRISLPLNSVAQPG